MAGGGVVLAEPDLEQTWLWTTPNRQTLGIAGTCDSVPPNSDVYAVGNTNLWFADEAHSQLEQARSGVVAPDPATSPAQYRAHRPSGYRLRRQSCQQAAIPEHGPGPQFRRRRPAERRHGQADRRCINPMFGHGTGTLSILAGKDIDGRSFGAAANLEIVPVRVANWVVLFSNSAIARAFDYVHCPVRRRGDARPCRDHEHGRPRLGGLGRRGQRALRAGRLRRDRGRQQFRQPADALHRLSGPLQPRHRRLRRDGRRTALCRPADPQDGRLLRAREQDATAIAAYTPNVPWAKFGCPDTVDLDGGGTSAATPQVAAAAALWMQKNKAALDAYPRGLDAGRGGPQGAVRQRPRRRRPPAGPCRARPAAGVRGARRRPGGGGGAENPARRPPIPRPFRILKVLTGLGVAASPEKPAHAGAGGAAAQPAVARGRKAAGGIRPSRRQGRERSADRRGASSPTSLRGTAGSSHRFARAEEALGRSPPERSRSPAQQKETADEAPPRGSAAAKQSSRSPPMPPTRRSGGSASLPSILCWAATWSFFELNEVELVGAAGKRT